ncbi:MAG: Cof-type HAD-IIB family hydrolase [Anaerovoracaceae bacterium]|jgi:Cof subfamily protein (haloacid dehalogenase superfamily)
MIKAIFYDIDGTLFSHQQNKIPDSAVRAVNEAHKKGIRTVIATGRPLPHLKMLDLSMIDVDEYMIMNGQLCLDRNYNTILENPIGARETETIHRMFDAGDPAIMILEKNKVYVNKVDDNMMEALDSVHTPRPAIGEFSGDKIYQAIAYVGEERTEEIRQAVPGCKVIRWHEKALDMISRNGSKAAAIEKYLEHFGIAREESMAFGDAGNDLEMLQYVGIGVAMGNAVEAVKQGADYITDDIDEDGLARGLHHFGVL